MRRSSGEELSMSLIAELQRRNVIRMAGLYLVGAWLLVQVAGTVLPMFGAPAWVPRTVVIVLAIGFIPALAFAWVFELTPSGLRKDAEVNPAESIAPQTAQRMNRMTVAILALALLYFGFDKFVLAPRHDAALVAATTQTVTADAKARAKTGVDGNSIAVLPFVNMSDDKQNEYFSDGLSEELLNLLAQLPQLRVIARTSSFSFKGKEVDVATIAKTLNVANVLEGSVRKSGNTLRITAQLIRASDSSHLWSQTYDRELTDIFKIQDEIAGAIAEALEGKLVGEPVAALSTRTANPAAYDYYLQGRAFTARRVDDNLKLAVAAFDRAIARDPSYSPAYSGRAFALALSQIWSPGLMPTEELVAQTRASADKALKLDPENVEAMIARGYVAMRHWDISGARADFERAYALAPENVDVLNLYADFQGFTGNLRDAERMKRKAMAMDPLAFVHPHDLFWILVQQSRLPEALAMAERSQGLGSPDAHWQMTVALAALGRFERAEREFAAICPANQAQTPPCMDLRIVLLVAAKHASEAKTLFEKLTANNGAERPPGFYSFLAGAYANDFIDIPKATQNVRMSLGGDSTEVLTPLRWVVGQAPRLPEEISRDPEWLAVWADPKLRDLMTAYRANILAFRQGK
jgi:TolB-like protein/tetratricopeptide (TPR) repeat protein